MSARIIQVPRPISRAPAQRPEKISKPRKPVEPSTLTAEYLRSILDYNPETGVLTRTVSTSPRVKVGDVAGSPDSAGYPKVKVQNRSYTAHRLVWLHYYGTWPKGEIDHINRIKDDNRIANLREVSHEQNMQNKSRYQVNTSGHTGVTWHKLTSKWQAVIRNVQKDVYLGIFDTKEEAIAARKAGELKYWGAHRAE